MGQFSDHAITSLWGDLLPSWGGVTGPTTRVPDEIQQIDGVPETWIEMFSKPDPLRHVVAPWEGMPRFHNYLRASVLDAGIGTGIGGPVLVYLVSNWLEMGLDQFEPGLMIGGAPASEGEISALEKREGPLPATLKTAWLAHSFCLLKNGRWLASLREESCRIVGTPTRLEFRGTVAGIAGRYQGLAVLEPGSAVSGCVVRRSGEHAWSDRVVYKERGGAMVDSFRNLEATFTDWEVSEWNEEQSSGA